MKKNLLVEAHNKKKIIKSPFWNSSSFADNSNVIDKESKNHHSSDLIDSSDDSTNCFNPKLAPVATLKEVINLLDSNDDRKFKSSVVNYSDDNEEYEFTGNDSFVGSDENYANDDKVYLSIGSDQNPRCKKVAKYSIVSTASSSIATRSRKR